MDGVEPKLITLMISGGIAPEFEAGPLDQFLGALIQRGVPVEHAIALYYAIGALALGSAVAISHNRALSAAGRPRIEALRRIARERDLTATSAHLAVIAEIEAGVGFDDALAALLDGIGRDRV